MHHEKYHKNVKSKSISGGLNSGAIIAPDKNGKSVRYRVVSWQNLSNPISWMECDSHVRNAPSFKLLDNMKRIDDAKQMTARETTHCSPRGNA